MDKPEVDRKLRREGLWSKLGDRQSVLVFFLADPTFLLDKVPAHVDDWRDWTSETCCPELQIVAQ